MPLRLNAPVLTLNGAQMNEINPRNVESLFGMWTVFSQCSQSIKDGKRLENMSWRLWARETLCCPPQPERAIVPAIDVPQSSQVPSLSNSVASDEESSDDETTPQQRTRQISYSSEDENSALSKSRGTELHLSANTLKKIVVGIQEKVELGPLSPSIAASLPPLKSLDESMTPKRLAEEDEEESCGKQMKNSTDSCISGTTIATSSTNTTRPSDHRNSDTSVSSDGLIRSGSVVHGFSPSSSFKPKVAQGMPMPHHSKLAPQTLKKAGMFQLGVSSDDDDGSSYEARIPSYRPQQRSSLSQSITKHQIQKKGLDSKTTSFRDIVEQRRMDSDAGDDEGAIASSDEEDDESAIDDEDDDEGEWEDSNSDDERIAAPEQYKFRRVESRPDLVSRPSMLSMQLDQKRRTSGLQNENSRSQPAFRRSRGNSPNGPSMPESPEENDDEPGLMMQSSKTKPKPIIMTTSSGPQPMAHSPRTARRNMLSTELTESLRRNLLWERQNKSQASLAYLKRSRNAQSMANLQGAAAPPPPDRNNQSWNHEFENPWEFNAKGW